MKASRARPRGPCRSVSLPAAELPYVDAAQRAGTSVIAVSFADGSFHIQSQFSSPRSNADRTLW